MLITEMLMEISESIERLEDRICDIAKDEVSEEIKDAIYHEGYEKGCIETKSKLLKGLEYAPNRWIPCFVRRYPPDDGLYLVTIRTDQGLETSAVHFMQGSWAIAEEIGEIVAWDTLPSPCTRTML